MKKELFVWVLVLLVAPLLNAGCQNVPAPAAKTDNDVTVSPNLLKTADWAGFKYLDVLSRAKTGESKALRQFLEFHGTTDGVDALDHAVACLELIPIAGDYPFANALVMSKPKLREVVLERLVLAQGRTKKTELQQPLSVWAPDVWAALHNERLPVIPESNLYKAKSDAAGGGAAADPNSSGGRGEEQPSGDSLQPAPSPAPNQPAQLTPPPAPKPASGAPKPKQ